MSNNFENVIATTGWGVCHYFIIGLCCLCAIAEASATFISLIVTRLLASDLKLHKSHAIAMNAACSLGMAVGAFFFGVICDAYGRKGSIPVTMVIVFCGSIALSFAQKNLLIYLSIFVLGVGLAGNNVVLRVYLIECLPVSRRGSCLAILDLLWLAGYLSALGISWSLVPSVIRIQQKKFRINSWRVLAGLGGAPCFAIACILSLLPPSPRFLLHKRRRSDALAVLQQIYAINSSKHADTYPAVSLENCIEADEDDDRETNGFLRLIYKFCLKTFRKLQQLFQSPLRATTFLGGFTWLCHFPGFLWFALWNTELLEELNKTNNNVTEFSLKNSTCIVDAEDMVLGFFHNYREINSSRFEYLLLLSLSYLLGELLLVFGVDIFGRNIFLITSRIVGTIATLILVVVSQPELRIVLSVLILAAFAISCTTTTIVLLENYPTRLRGTILGVTRLLPFIVAFLGKLLLKMECMQSAVAVSMLFASAAITGLPLRDLTSHPMRE